MSLIQMIVWYRWLHVASVRRLLKILHNAIKCYSCLLLMLSVYFLFFCCQKASKCIVFHCILEEQYITVTVWLYFLSNLWQRLNRRKHRPSNLVKQTWKAECWQEWQECCLQRPMLSLLVWPQTKQQKTATKTSPCRESRQGNGYSLTLMTAGSHF